MYTASIFFMGEYRPACFQAATAADAVAMARLAINMHPDRSWFIERLDEACRNLTSRPYACTAFAAEHGCRGVSLVARPHDPFPDDVTRKLPACPGW